MKHIIYSDERKLKVVIAHILKNAIKFTTKGEISISLTNSYKEGAICIIIEDTGIGITEAKLVSILSNSENVEDMNELFVKHGGLGIGLKVVKGICEKLNIIFEIHSKENIGTKVYLHIEVFKTNRLISTNTFYKQDFETVSSLSKQSTKLKNPINYIFFPSKHNESSNSSKEDSPVSFNKKHKTAAITYRRNSDSNLDNKMINDEVKLNQATNLKLVNKKMILRNSFLLNKEIPLVDNNKEELIEDLTYQPLSKSDSKLNDSKVYKEEIKETHSNKNLINPDQNTSLLEEAVTSDFRERNYHILDKLNTNNYKVTKKNSTSNNFFKINSKSFKHMSSLSKIDIGDNSDSGGWNHKLLLNDKTINNENNMTDDIGRDVKVQRKDTIFLDLKNISGELGYSNTKLSNNSLFPFKLSSVNSKAKRKLFLI